VTITLTDADAAAIDLHIETLEEALFDARHLLAGEDVGWTLIGDNLSETGGLPREYVKSRVVQCRVHALLDPLIRRGVLLHVGYVWGGGAQIAVKNPKGGQDVNGIVQAFLDDPSNLASFTSASAREESERSLQTDGELFHALITSPLTGRVQVRAIPALQVTDIITNPEDADEVWFFKRVHTAKVLRAQGIDTVTATEQRTTYYPHIWHRPATRARTINGHEVRWDAPVIHTKVNASGGRGTPDVLAALPWSVGYKELLGDWTRLVKALSRFAFQTTAKTKAGAASTRAAITTGAVGSNGQVGQTAITPEGQRLEAIGKSGATIDLNAGRPIAAMVAAALGFPVTMLLADPGVTGARATAETLDTPLRNTINARRRLHSDLHGQVLEYVIREAVRAPQGALKGRIVRDPVTGRELVTLLNDEDYEVEVTFPSLDDIDVKVLTDAIATADGMDKLPPELLARLAMQALGVDDIDGWMDKVLTDDGEFLPPSLHAQISGPGAAYGAGVGAPPEPAA